MTEDLKWMHHALKLAKEAEIAEEVPVGAVIVFNNKIIGQGWNQPISQCDPSAHAEIIALRHAGLHQKNYRLLNTTLYVTLEPCIMCLGAMIHARIKRLVFGAKDPKIGSVCHADALLKTQSFNHQIKWHHLEEIEADCMHSLKHFFSSKRKIKAHV